MEISSLEGWKVMVPVTAGRTSLAERLRDLGARVESVEFIAITAPADPALLAATARRWCVGEFDWMAVTSRNAVDAVAAAALPMRIAAAQPAARVAAVGEATLAVCEAHGLDVSVVPTDRLNAAGLAAAMPEGQGQSVLVPVGNRAGTFLERALERKGYVVESVEAYRTIDGPGPSAAQRAQLEAGEIDIVVVTSASVAERLASSVGHLGDGTMVVAIGESTAAGAKAAGLTVAATAERPSYDGVLSALARIMSDREGSTR